MHLRDRLFPAAGRVLLGLLLVAAASTLAGCENREPITQYKVPKPPPIEPVAGPNPHRGAAQDDAPPQGEPTDRTLGAIVPLAGQSWFFKLTGPADAVADEEEDFSAFVKSVRFADGQPSWTLPAGWQEQPGNQIRYATLTIPGEGQPLEVSVTALPNPGGDTQGYLLANVNRWRGQLRLPAIGQEQLAAESSEIELDGATATLVNLLGHAAPGSMGRPPFFSGGRDGN